MPYHYDKIFEEFINVDLGDGYDKQDRDTIKNSVNHGECSFISRIKKDFLNSKFEKRVSLMDSFRNIFSEEISELNKLQLLNFLDIFRTYGQRDCAEDQIKPLFRNINPEYLNDQEFVHLLLNHFQGSKMILLNCFLNDNYLYKNIYLNYKPIKKYIDGLIISNIHNIFTFKARQYSNESDLWRNYYQNILDNIEFDNEILDSILIYNSQSKHGLNWFETFITVFSDHYEFTHFSFEEDTINNYIDLSTKFLLSNYNETTLNTSAYNNALITLNQIVCFSKSTLKRYYHTRLKYIIQMINTINEKYFENINNISELNNTCFEYIEEDDIEELNKSCNMLIRKSDTGISVMKTNPLLHSVLYKTIISNVNNMLTAINNNDTSYNETIETMIENKSKLKNVINYSKLAN